MLTSYQLSIVNGVFSVEERPRIDIPFAENNAIAVDMLLHGQLCRVNASTLDLALIRNRLANVREMGNGKRVFA